MSATPTAEGTWVTPCPDTSCHVVHGVAIPPAVQVLPPEAEHSHGDQPCDPSEEAAIAQFERDEGPLRHVGPESGPESEHIAELDCWCHPTAERQPNGAYLFIHREETV